MRNRIKRFVIKRPASYSAYSVFILLFATCIVKPDSINGLSGLIGLMMFMLYCTMYTLKGVTGKYVNVCENINAVYLLLLMVFLYNVKICLMLELILSLLPVAIESVGAALDRKRDEIMEALLETIQVLLYKDNFILFQTRGKERTSEEYIKLAAEICEMNDVTLNDFNMYVDLIKEKAINRDTKRFVHLMENPDGKIYCVKTDILKSDIMDKCNEYVLGHMALFVDNKELIEYLIKECRL